MEVSECATILQTYLENFKTSFGNKRETLISEETLTKRRMELNNETKNIALLGLLHKLKINNIKIFRISK